MIDATLTFTSLTDTTILDQINHKITEYFGQMSPADYNVRNLLTAFQTQRFGTPFYYVKALVESTGNSIEVHEFVFVKKDLQVFTAAKLPTSRTTLQAHPRLDLLRGMNGLNCENLSSQIFCELAPNCVNKMLTSGVCEEKH